LAAGHLDTTFAPARSSNLLHESERTCGDVRAHDTLHEEVPFLLSKLPKRLWRSTSNLLNIIAQSRLTPLADCGVHCGQGLAVHFWDSRGHEAIAHLSFGKIGMLILAS
jgi:hypothetical protein